MNSIHALRFVSAAIRHAECLADEALDLKQDPLAERLAAKARALAEELEETVATGEALSGRRDERQEAWRALADAYAKNSLDLEARLPRDLVASASPGGVLDVVDRARFRLQRLARSERADVEPFTLDLARALRRHDDAVEVYLECSAIARERRDRVVVKSQALRLELEHAKQALLARAPVGSEAEARIRRRAVRTKRARWIDEARARDLLDLAPLPIS